jgi:hypothetical protein
MWNIQIANNLNISSIYDLAGYQLLEKHIDIIYDSFDEKYCEDYKVLNNALEQHIVAYINNIPLKTVELYVYNYGIDKAIVLINNRNYNINNASKNKHTNTSSKSLLFAIFINRFSIYYVVSVMSNSKQYNYSIFAIIKIQRFWRKVLEFRKKVILGTIDSEIVYLIEKINKEIVGESVKKVLIYMVNKFRKRLSKTLRI